MKKKIIISVIILITIVTGVTVVSSNQEETTEERWAREQVKSGPFTIDKGEYNIGEKIFINAINLPEDEKGSMMFFRPLNSTAWSNYKTIDFNGNVKTKFNLYFEPQLSEVKNICSTNDLAGTWIVKFIGTEYPDISFKILNQTSSWDKRIFEPIC